YRTRKGRTPAGGTFTVQDSLLERRRHPGQPRLCGISLSAAEGKARLQAPERPHRLRDPGSRGALGFSQTARPDLRLIAHRTSDSPAKQQSNGLAISTKP